MDANYQYQQYVNNSAYTAVQGYHYMNQQQVVQPQQQCYPAQIQQQYSNKIKTCRSKRVENINGVNTEVVCGVVLTNFGDGRDTDKADGHAKCIKCFKREGREAYERKKAKKDMASKISFSASQIGIPMVNQQQTDQGGLPNLSFMEMLDGGNVIIDQEKQNSSVLESKIVKLEEENKRLSDEILQLRSYITTRDKQLNDWFTVYGAGIVKMLNDNSIHKQVI